MQGNCGLGGLEVDRQVDGRLAADVHLLERLLVLVHVTVAHVHFRDELAAPAGGAGPAAAAGGAAEAAPEEKKEE